MVSIPQLDQCCCGCSLKTASIIIGSLSAFAGVFFIVTICLELFGIELLVDDNSVDNEIYSFLEGNVVVEILSIVICFTVLMLSVVMVAGAVLDKPKYILPWIIFEMVAIVIELLELVVSGVYLLVKKRIAEGLGYFAAVVFFGILCPYLLIVVYSHYRNLRRQDQQKEEIQ